MGCAFIKATILYVPTCMPSGGDGEPLIICVVAGSGISWDCDIKDFDKVAAGERFVSGM